MASLLSKLETRSYELLESGWRRGLNNFLGLYPNVEFSDEDLNLIEEAVVAGMLTYAEQRGWKGEHDRETDLKEKLAVAGDPLLSKISLLVIQVFAGIKAEFNEAWDELRKLESESPFDEQKDEVIVDVILERLTVYGFIYFLEIEKISNN